MVVLITSTGGVTDLRFAFPEPVDQGLVTWAADYLNERLAGAHVGSRAVKVAFDEPSLSPRERTFLLVIRSAFEHAADEDRRLFVGGAAGLLDEGRDEVDDLVRARHIPSPQLIGTPERRSIDLSSLADLGVEVVGRLGSLRDGVAQFSGGLANTCRLADLKMQRLLDRFDDWARHNDLDLDDPPRRPEPIRRSGPAVLDLDLHRRGIRTIVWATGYRPDHSWLDVPVLDRRGRVRHDGGVVLDSPGLYLLGGNLLRSRRSSYLAGADADTLALADHLRDHLDRVRLDRSRRRHPLEVLALDRGRASTAAP